MDEFGDLVIWMREESWPAAALLGGLGAIVGICLVITAPGTNDKVRVVLGIESLRLRVLAAYLLGGTIVPATLHSVWRSSVEEQFLDGFSFFAGMLWRFLVFSGVEFFQVAVITKKEARLKGREGVNELLSSASQSKEPRPNES